LFTGTSADMAAAIAALSLLGVGQVVFRLRNQLPVAGREQLTCAFSDELALLCSSVLGVSTNAVANDKAGGAGFHALENMHAHDPPGDRGLRRSAGLDAERPKFVCDRFR
jgi:hypothetical protein